VGTRFEGDPDVTIVPMLRVGMQFWTLRVLFMTRSVTKCIPTLERGNEIESN
jgi:hypothetical protein